MHKTQFFNRQPTGGTSQRAPLKQEAHIRALDKPTRHKRNKPLIFLTLPTAVFMWVVGWSLYWIGSKREMGKPRSTLEHEEITFNVPMLEEKCTAQQKQTLGSQPRYGGKNSIVRRSILDSIFKEMVNIRHRLDNIEKTFSNWNPQPLDLSDTALLLLPDHLRRTYITVASNGECAAT